MDKPRYDRLGNLLLPNMIVENGIYKIRRVVEGARKKVSLGFKVGDDFTKVKRKYYELQGQIEDQRDGFQKKEKARTLREWWAYYRATFIVGQHTPRMGKAGDKRVAILTTKGEAYYRVDADMTYPLELLGNKSLSDLTPKMLQDYVRERRGMTYKRGGVARPFSHNSLNREFTTLKAVLSKATKLEEIDKNPFAEVEWGLAKAGQVRERVMSLAEQAQLEEKLSARKVRWLNFMVGTGLRVHEADGLQPEHVNLTERWVQVTRKTRGLAKKVQRVPLVDVNVIPIVEQQLEREGALWNHSYTTYTKWMDVACKCAGLTGITPHTLRHTFATRYLTNGGDIYILSKILGHSSVRTTEKVYAHLLSDNLLTRSKGVTLGVTVSLPAAGEGAKVLAWRPDRAAAAE